MVLTGLTGVGQCTRGLVFHCVLRSKGCLFVPWSSAIPVATWAWPFWVVSRRRLFEAVFILLEFPSPPRRIFIGSHSLPPFLVRRIGLSQRKEPILNHLRSKGQERLSQEAVDHRADRTP
jgi:hypothetical protein